MSGNLGKQVMSEHVTIVDDALAPDALGLTFDFEGVPKRPVALVEDGVAVGPVTDSYWAAQTGRANTGHALPAPNRSGPMPLNLEMAAGDATLDELIGSVERGVYVTRFHYVNVEDPVPVTLTGMTRDGTFLIENGELTRPLKNLRFTQVAPSRRSKAARASPPSASSWVPRRARRSCRDCCWRASRSPARRRRSRDGAATASRAPRATGARPAPRRGRDSRRAQSFSTTAPSPTAAPGMLYEAAVSSLSAIV